MNVHIGMMSSFTETILGGRIAGLIQFGSRAI